jgi:hypothetical protein
MLRASTQVSGEVVNLKGIVEGNEVQTGLRGGEALIRFAETSVGDTSIGGKADDIRDAREAVKEELGENAMVDAAGVIANFQRMVRIADATGIPLDTPVAMMTGSIREDLGLNEYGSAGNTPALSLPQRLLGRVLQPALPLVVKLMTRNMAKPD